ncbi:MAG: hypothetical protein HWE07_12345 [Cytophagia bacterium]|nr:hypothetical protein [Cytophagia bacterium]
MKKLLFFAPFLILLLCSCESKKEEVNKVQLVQEYIQALNDFDYQGIISKFNDSIRMKEIVYSSTFSKADFYDHFQWDSIFQPKYEILKIEEKADGTIDMEISKQGPRILFLNEKPTVNHEIISFEKGKIREVHILEYIVFDEETWSRKRQNLLDWIDANHPELNGFIHDQTKQGALNYLKALEYYKMAMDGN